MFPPEARKFHVALLGALATVLVVWLESGEWRPPLIAAIPAVLSAFAVYWAPNDPAPPVEVGEVTPPAGIPVAVAVCGHEWETLPGTRVHDTHSCVEGQDDTIRTAAHAVPKCRRRDRRILARPAPAPYSDER